MTAKGKAEGRKMRIMLDCKDCGNPHNYETYLLLANGLAECVSCHARTDHSDLKKIGEINKKIEALRAELRYPTEHLDALFEDARAAAKSEPKYKFLVRLEPA